MLQSKEYADGSRINYTYTSGNKLHTRTWARQAGGQPLVTTYAYDPATGELTGIDYSDTTADIGFVYDRLGRQRRITDAVGSRTFAYNDHLQLESESITGLYSQLLTRTYETTGVPGRATGLNLGADYSVTYGYQSATGRFETLAWNIAGRTDTATYAYAPDSDLLNQLSTTSGRRTTYAYEPQRNLKTQVQNRFNTQLISQYDYRYDTVGRRTAAANSGAAFTQAAYSAYGYNDRSELTSAQRYLGADIANTTQPVPAEQRGYLYDPIGNRTQAQADSTITTYAPANAVNQYTAITTNSAVYTPSYDPDGNLQNAPNNMRYTYDAENRLIEAGPQSPASGDTRVQFVYDYMGRRVKKSISTYSSGSWLLTSESLFLYDGWNLIKKTTTPAGATAVDKYFVWGLDLSQSLQGAGGVGGLLASVQGSLTYNYFFDANGNVGQVVEAGNGSLAAHYEYDPYGNEVRAVGPVAGENEYRFSTKYYDEEANLYYYGYRNYSAELGRWINKDPKEEYGGLNLYGFVNNQSPNRFDTLGLFWAPAHTDITTRAIEGNRWDPEIRKIVSGLKEILIQNNLDVDKSYLDKNFWHFNRNRDQSVEAAKNDYSNNLVTTLSSFDESSSKSTDIDCQKALKYFGNLTHAWQDYYAHGVHQNINGGGFVINIKLFGIVGATIDPANVGYIEGNPSNIPSFIIPSSFGGIPEYRIIGLYDLGEHGFPEPSDRAPDRGSRVGKAEIFTKEQLAKYIPLWFERCKCTKTVKSWGEKIRND